jgi:hypothetical protein
MKKVLMLHGINHNMFGKRDPVQYGTITLSEIDNRLQALAAELGVQVESFQTNSGADGSNSNGKRSSATSRTARRLYRQLSVGGRGEVRTTQRCD